MRATAVVLKVFGAIVVAYLGGSVVFGFLADGSWVFDLLALVLRPGILEPMVLAVVWGTRGGLFLLLLHQWALPRNTSQT
ncbi:MAG: hypothetical protein ACREQ5_15620 [Candidatus Dormibacteria bacterium]